MFFLFYKIRAHLGTRFVIFVSIVRFQSVISLLDEMMCQHFSVSYHNREEIDQPVDPLRRRRRQSPTDRSFFQHQPEVDSLQVGLAVEQDLRG